MCATGAKDAYTAFDVGIGSVFLTGSGLILMRGDVSFQILVAHKDGYIYVVDKEEAIGIVFKMVFNSGEETVGSDRLGGKPQCAVFVAEIFARNVDAECVAILAIKKGDDRLIKTATRQSIPLN